METFPESDKPEERMLKDTAESIKRLYAQIRKMPELSEQAKVIDQVLLNRLQDLKGTASTIIDQFKEQRKMILQRFDNWIMPIAKDVLDGFLQDAVQLKDKLDDKLNHIEETTPDEWNDQAKGWAQLYDRWHDRKGLINKILEVVADRTKHLIDKDIQIIHDYQSQSLAHLPKESEVFKNIEERLKHAIAEPLKQLVALRNRPLDHTSLQQASEWVANLQEKRENYFDQLLMKIDHVTKEVVQVEERVDGAAFREVEGELIFMERELEHINSDLSQLHLGDESDKQFIAARLEGLLDHAEQLDECSLPRSLKQRVLSLKKGIENSLKIL